MKNRKIIHGIILTVLLICTTFLIYSILTDPFGKHDIILALAVTAGFIALGGRIGKKNDKFPLSIIKHAPDQVIHYL